MSSRSEVRALFALGLAVLLSVGYSETAAAQDTGRIQGQVVAAQTGQPLAGAQITLRGASIGTLTNADGRFLLLNVPVGRHMIQATHIGYDHSEQAVEVQADQAATANFRLAENAVALDELVVTGVATEVRRKEIGNSLDAITARELEHAPVLNPQEALAARAPGVTFMQSSGQVGSGSTLKIRGTVSASQDTEPLIYVDGVRIFNLPTRAGWHGRAQVNPLQDIPAEDIERIEVVKGASATTLYGTEASSGVIQIFTKRGVAGRPIWNAEITTGISEMGDVVDPERDPTELYTNCSGVMRGIDTGGRDKGTFNEFVDPTCPEDGDWWERGAQQGYSLSVRGGMGGLTYYVSGNYSDARGTLPTGRSRDGGFRGNFTFAPLDNLTFTLNSAYTRRKTRWVQDGNNSSGFLLNVGRGYRNYLKGGKGEGEEADCGLENLTRLYGADVAQRTVDGELDCVTNRYLFDDRQFTTSDHFITGFTTQYNPTENFNHRFTVGWDYSYINNESTLVWGNLDYPPGYFWDENTYHTKLSLDYAGSVRNTFGADVVSTFSWGGQLFRDRHRWTEIDVDGFAGPGIPTLETGASLTYRADDPFAETNAGFFLQEMLGWKDRLFVTAGLRVDGNSAFGDNFGLQTYPKVSAAYVVSDHDFWPQWFETFKLRGAMGQSGKAPGAFDKLRTWAPTIGDEGSPGFTPRDVGNSDLGPETTQEVEGGLDISMFAGRIGIEATAFKAVTTDALVGVTLPPSLGFLASQTQNIGEIESSGLEFQLTGGLIRTRNIDWTTRVNISRLSSEVIDVGGEEIFADNKAEFREGFPAPTYFGRLVTNPDEIAEPEIVRDTAIGPVFPTRLYGISTTLRLFNSLTFDALVEHQGGHYLPNYTGYQNGRRGAWVPCFEAQQKMYVEKSFDGLTALERARCAIGGHHSDFWVEKADFTKLRSVSLTYDLPERLIGTWARNASLTLAGKNLALWTDYSGTDPEVEDAADRFATVFDGGGDFGRRDYYQIPPSRTWLLSFRFSF